MKVKMLETVQGVGISGVLIGGTNTVSVLEPGSVYEVDLSLGAWLVDNRKAEELRDVETAVTAVTAPKPEPKPAADGAPTEPPSSEPLMNTKSQEAPKRARRTKS